MITLRHLQGQKKSKYLDKYHSSSGKWVGDIFSLGIAASGEQTHVQAYVSVKVRCPGKNHIVALGFTQGRNRWVRQSNLT